MHWKIIQFDFKKKKKYENSKQNANVCASYSPYVAYRVAFLLSHLGTCSVIYHIAVNLNLHPKCKFSEHAFVQLSIMCEVCANLVFHIKIYKYVYYRLRTHSKQS